MIIKELILTSFGKFKNKKVTLNNGLNLVYGNNEAGKTTIQKFIEGMLFGFFNPLTKTKRYCDEYYKYLPWDGSDYKGILHYTYKDSTYIIERNLLKGSDEVKIYDRIDGQDITYMYPYDKTIRLVKPAELHFDINHISYTNTVSISQLKSKTEKALAKEIKDSLINLDSSYDENISVKKAINKLELKIDNIGTKNREKSSPYGKASRELNELKIERAKAITINKEIKDYQFKLNILYDELDNLNKSKNEIEIKISQTKIIEDINDYNEIIKINDEINILNKELESMNRYRNINANDYHDVIVLENSIIDLKESINKLNDKVKNTRSKIEEIDIFLNKEVNNERLYRLNGSKKKGEKKLKIINSYSILILLLCTVTLLGGIYNKIFLYVSIIPLIFLLLIMFNKRNIKSSIIKLEKEINNFNETYKSHYQKYNEQNNFYNVKLNEEILELKDLKVDLNLKREKIENILNNNNIISIEDLKEAVKIKNNYDNIVQKISYNKLLINKILKNRNIDEIKNRISNLEYIAVTNDSYDNDLNINFDNINNEILIKEKEISGVEQKIHYLNNKIRSLCDIDDDMCDKINIINKYENELKSLNLAKDTINEISKNIQKEISPKLNKKVSEIISVITKGKYTDVRISEDLKIKVVNSENNRLRDIENLSLGTIDQFYFALRVSIIDVITNKNELPIILDDSFIQYDDERLERILNLLVDIGKDRQIILFTCQNREKKILDRINKKYNYIKL